jgi:diguanylate cyclase
MILWVFTEVYLSCLLIYLTGTYAAIAFILHKTYEKGCFMTTFDDSTRTVAEIAKNVILNTTERSIPLTPENYRVWFEYFLGSNQELKASIDELIASENSFSQEINERLYTEYLKGDKKEILQEVHKETHKIFQNIFQTTLSTSDLTSNYSAKMKEYSNKLDEAKDLTQIQHFIVDIIKDTNNVAESSRQLNQQLEEATSQIGNLSKQLEETQKEVLLDALTGLNNRRAFDRKIKELCENYKKKAALFSVLMLDIDFFKKFNDQYGHQIGDEVLSIVGANLKKNLKGKDFQARYGGEEFIILLPNTRLNNACVVADQLRADISKKRLKIKKSGQTMGNITVSIGVSEIRERDTAISVVERADAALYLAKDSGRNNVKSEKDLELAETGTKV